MRTADRGEGGKTLHYVKSSLEEPKRRGKHRLMALSCFQSTLPCSRQHSPSAFQSSDMSKYGHTAGPQAAWCLCTVALFLGDSHNKMTRKPERAEFHLLFYKTEDEGRKYFFCNITHIMEKAWLITRTCVVPGATRGISSLDLQEWHG